jgi:outer membrane protein assembly factor BamB
LLYRQFREMCLLFALCALCLLVSCGSSPAPVASQPHVKATPQQVIPSSLLQGASAGDWPMFGYDPAHTGYVDARVQTRALVGKPVWMRKFGAIFSSAVAGNGMVYIASSSGYLYALQQATGRIAWRDSIGDYLTDSTPALEGRVLFVSTHSNTMEALNALTGAVYWSFDTTEKIQAPPMLDGSRLLVASRTTLWALDVTTGHVLWKFHRGAVGWPTTATPAVAGDMVYTAPGSGTQLWALNLATGQAIWSFDTGDRITSTPLVQGNTVYFATWHGVIFALDRLHGTKRWSYALNATASQTVVDGVGGNMALANGRLFVGDYRGELVSIDAIRGRVVWRYATGAQILGTPVVASGMVYIGSGDGYFYALLVTSGRPAWRFAVGEIRSSAILANGRLYVGSIGGAFYAFS